MVSTLADDGLVKRSEDKDDARGVLVTTTPRGRRMHQRANEQRQRYFAEALKYLNDEELVAMRALTIQLERFTLMLDARD
jgi:DNA-binding MarR family transcriptional regulator